MVVASIIFDWIRKYEIRNLLNTPCAGPDCLEFIARGITHILGVNILEAEGSATYHVQGDLNTWKPPGGPWDAAYVNCLFCTTVIGERQAVAENIASWPVRHILVYDTITKREDSEHDWHSAFFKANWKVLDQHTEGDNTLIEVWGK